MDFSPKKFFSGFNFLDGAVRGKLYHQILIVACILGVVWFILDRATGKTNQTSVTVGNGGTSNINYVTEVQARRWSVGTFVQTRTRDSGDVSYGLRFDFLF